MQRMIIKKWEFDNKTYTYQRITSIRLVKSDKLGGKNQKLTGYALGLELKKYLLDLEKRNN